MEGCVCVPVHVNMCSRAVWCSKEQLHYFSCCSLLVHCACVDGCTEDDN